MEWYCWYTLVGLLVSLSAYFEEKRFNRMSKFETFFVFVLRVFIYPLPIVRMILRKLN